MKKIEMIERIERNSEQSWEWERIERTILREEEKRNNRTFEERKNEKRVSEWERE